MEDTTWACVVGKCRNKLEYEKDPVTGSLRPVRKFYAFPSGTDENSRAQLDGWIEFVMKSKGATGSNLKWIPSRMDNICCAHFVREVKSDDPRKPNFLPTIFPNACDFPSQEIQYGLLDVIGWWDQKGASAFPDLQAIVTTKEQPAKKQTKVAPATPELKSFVLIENDVESVVPSVLRSITVHEDLSFEAYVRGVKIPASSIFTDEDTRTCKFHSVQEFAAGLHVFKNVGLCRGVGWRVECKSIPSKYNGKVIRVEIGDGKYQSRVLSNDCERFINAKVCAHCKKLWNIISVSLNRGKQPFITDPSDEETTESKIARLEKSIEIYKLEVLNRDNKHRSLKNRIEVLKAALVEEQKLRGETTTEKQLGRIPVRRKEPDGCESQDPHEPDIRIVHPSKIMEKPEKRVTKVIRNTPEQAAKIGNIIPGNLIKVPSSQLQSIQHVTNLNESAQ